MPASAVHFFTDADDYASAIRAGTVEATVTGRGQFTAKRTWIDFHRLWTQRFSDNLPRILHSVNVPDRAIITFRTELGPSLFAGGAEMLPNTLVRHSQSQEYHQRSSGFAAFAGMSLPVEELQSLGAAFAGCDPTPPRDPVVVTPSPSAMIKLQQLHAAAGQLAEDAPEIIAHPEAARGLEQALIEALVGCLSTCEGQENSFGQRQHSIVMSRFRKVVEENLEEPLYIPEICKAIRVSTRTLQMCCREHLGMGPKRYLVLRRMHLVRRTLLQARPDATTVAAVAMRYGFWELGRFAVKYRSLFDELPSATLGRQSA
jgi:AraC-like DNA-binding protein